MLSHLLRLTLALLVTSFCHAQIKPMTETYLGDGKRNYYGNYAPTKLRIKWKKHLGKLDVGLICPSKFASGILLPNQLR